MNIEGLRHSLIREVEGEYANLAMREGQQHMYQSTTEIIPVAYYENIFSPVIHEISKGTYDSCHSGKEVINKAMSEGSNITG